MKKIIGLMLIMVLLSLCFSTVAQAKVGDIIGRAEHTDIVAYINGDAIASYAANGQSVIVAEDLRAYGFNVEWNLWNKSLTIDQKGRRSHTPTVTKSYRAGTFYRYILETDIKVYAGGKQITAYAIDGRTLIPIEELAVFGAVQWNPTERTIELQAWGLGYYYDKEPIVFEIAEYAQRNQNYASSLVPDYGVITGQPQLTTYRFDGGSSNWGRVYPLDAYSHQKYLNYLTQQGWTIEEAFPPVKNPLNKTTIESVHATRKNPYVWMAIYINSDFTVSICYYEE